MAFDLLALAVAAACLLAAVLGHAGQSHPRLDALTHFAPIWLMGAGLAGAYALALNSPARLPLLTMSALGVAAAGLLIAPEFLRDAGPRAPRDAPHQIKIIQFNAWDENKAPERSVKWILDQQADLVVVEQINEGMRLEILRKGGFHYVSGIGATGIYSRTPALGRGLMLGEPWDEWPTLARGSFLGPDGRPFTVVGLHLTWPIFPLQKVQLRRLTGMLDGYDQDRMIMVGDFNLTPWSFTLRRLDQRLKMIRRDRAVPTWPGQAYLGEPFPPLFPLLPIDHVYAGPAWRTVSVTRGPRLGSDHYPIVAVLALKP